ncbi:MAG: AtpZ/AtpI family protein [Gammaproteobacteria bacterium]|nr:AtpZ/AtpI family protein [Gammaproteobacteria bacterium]
MEKKQGAGLLLIGVGTHMTAMVVTGFALGYGVDTYFETKPLFMLIFGALGFVGGTLKAHKMLVRF